MSFNFQTKRLLPRVDKSGLHVADMGASNHVIAITVPDGAKGVVIFFMDSTAANMVRGRVGFAGEDESATITAADTDDTLGHHPPYFETYNLEGWAKVLHVACSTANAKLFGAWSFA